MRHIEVIKDYRKEWPKDGDFYKALSHAIKCCEVVENLAEELHCAGLNAYVDYKKMGKSAEQWNKFRRDLARAIHDRIGGVK